MKAIDDATITITLFDILVIESRARPWDTSCGSQFSYKIEGHVVPGLEWDPNPTAPPAGIFTDFEARSEV